MLKLIAFSIFVAKASVFAIVVLVLAHFIQWNGRSVADRMGSVAFGLKNSSTLREVGQEAGRTLESLKKGLGSADRIRASKSSATRPNESKEKPRDRLPAKPGVHTYTPDERNELRRLTIAE